MLKRFLTVAVAGMLLSPAAPAAAAFLFDRTLAIGTGGTFWLDADHGSVSVLGDSPSGVIVQVVSDDNDFTRNFDIAVEEREGDARLIIRRRTGFVGEVLRTWRGWDHVSRRTTITVRVPAAVLVGISTGGGGISASGLTGSTRLRTAGGRISAENMHGHLDLRTSGGPIAVRGVRGNLVTNTSGGAIVLANITGSVNARTHGGPIEIDSASGDVDAVTSGGHIHVRRAGGHVNARTAGGPVIVNFAPGNARGGDLFTSGGGVVAEVDPSVALSLDASSSGGRVECDLPVAIRGTISPRTLQGGLNGGGPILRLRAGGGGVRIGAIRQ